MPMRALATAVLILAAMVSSASAAPPLRPSTVAGWPALGPSGGDAFVAANGTVLGSVPVEAGSDHGTSEGYSAAGVPLWRVPYRPVCGNCDGPAVPALSASGVLGPIGWFGDGLWSLDLAGKDVPPCAGAIGPDGSCYALQLNPNPGGPVSVSRVGVWSFSDAAMPSLYDDEINQPTIAFDATTAYVQVPAAQSQLLALDRASGRLLWRQTFPSRMIGPQRRGDGTIVVALPALSGSATTLLGLAPTGTERWRASVPGEVQALVVDPRGSRAYLALPNAVVAVAAGKTRTLLRTPQSVASLAIGPGGTLVVGSFTPGTPYPLAVIRGIDRTGRVRWLFAQPTVVYGDDVGTPAVAGDGTVLVSVGDLLFRIDPRRPAPAAPGRARLVVRSQRNHSDGPEQLCPSGRPASCSPATPRGTVAELRLPRGTPRVWVTMTLHARSDILTNVWQARILAGAGSQWVAVRQPSEDCPDCGGGPVAVTPGAFVLTAAWSLRGHIHRVRTPITIVS